MKTIVIKSQTELNALPDSFEEYTRIIIQSETKIIMEASNTENFLKAEQRHIDAA